MIDYRALLKQYMADVVYDDPTLGARCAQSPMWSTFKSGTPEHDALIEILKEIDPTLVHKQHSGKKHNG